MRSGRSARARACVCVCVCLATPETVLLLVHFTPYTGSTPQCSGVLPAPCRLNGLCIQCRAQSHFVVYHFTGRNSNHTLFHLLWEASGGSRGGVAAQMVHRRQLSGTLGSFLSLPL